MATSVLHGSIEDQEVSLRKLTIEEYHRLGEAGILHPNDRVELIDGLLFQMASIGPEHQFIVEKLSDIFGDQKRGRFKVGPGRPIPIPDFNEPQPDIVLFKPMPEPGDNTFPLKTSIWSSRFPTPQSDTILKKSFSLTRTLESRNIGSSMSRPGLSEFSASTRQKSSWKLRTPKGRSQSKRFPDMIVRLGELF